jgi:AcrR family transcriptional regulator
VARPRIDVESVQATVIAEAERMLAETGGRRLNLSEIAARVGLSQSYLHRFFPTKADLVRALAAEWFAGIEALSAAILGRDAPALDRLEVWVLEILAVKRARYDDAPALFAAYLELAGEHPDLVREHALRLRSDLRAILADAVPEGRQEAAVTLVEDATWLFRVPHCLPLARARVTDEAARAVLAVLRGALAAQAGGDPPA